MKAKRDLIADCDAQLEVLYDSLGKHLYENIENGRVSFEFQNKDKRLAGKAGEILDGIRSLSAPQDKGPEPEKRIEPAAPEPAKSAGSADRKRARKPKPEKRIEPAAHKDEAADSTGSGLNFCGEEAVIARPNEMRPKQSPPAEEISSSPTSRNDKDTTDQRGSLERYTELMIELFEIKKKLLALKKDIEEYLSLATVHLWDSASSGTDVAVGSLRVIEEEIISLIRNNMEAVQDLMTRKKESAKKDHRGEYSDQALLSGEIEFFKRASADIRHTSHQVEALVKNAVTLFEDIRRIYEEGVAADMQVKRDCGLVEESGTRSDKPDAFDTAMEDALLAEAAPQAVAAMEEDPEPQDEGLLEAAGRRLALKNVTVDEKLQILGTLFRSIPERSVAFILGLLKDADTPVKKQLVDMLIKMDNPILVDIYREFLNSPDALLRMHGIMGLKRIGSPDARDAIILAVDDTDANVRRLVANCLDSFVTDSETSAIMRLANDPDETVARIAIRKLGLMKSRVSFIQVLPKLDSPNEKIRREAIDALKTMTGTDLGYKYLAPEPQRRASVKSWQKLLSENQSNPHFLEEMRAGSKAGMAAPAKKPGAVAARTKNRSKAR